jgi:hypothetical protein
MHRHCVRLISNRSMPFNSEVQAEIIDLIGPLSTFLQAAENHWLGRRPDGVVNWP